LFFGNHVAVSPSPIWRFAEADTASSFSGSSARSIRRSRDQRNAPFCQASPSATTWSTSTLGPPPRTYWTVVAV
jgi:hypothetical protein